MKTKLTTLAGLLLAVSSAYAMNAVHGDPGLLEAELRTIPGENAGVVQVWNTKDDFHVKVLPDKESWLIRRVDIYVGYELLARPGDLGGDPILGYPMEYADPVAEHELVLNLSDDLGLQWGQPWEAFRTQTVAVKVHLESEDSNPIHQTAWALNTALDWPPEDQLIFEGEAGYQFFYECQHPRSGHFIDSPVKGLAFDSSTHQGKTGDGGLFNYFPGEKVDLAIGDVSLGSALGGHKTTPLDIFESADTSDPEVINMARLLQSLDADGNPTKGIEFNTEIEASLASAMGSMGITEIDFANTAEMDELISRTVSEGRSRGLDLVEVSADEAKGNLDKALDSNMFRKNVSKTPELASAKSKLNVMGIWFPAKKANGDPAFYEDENGVEQTGVPYYDEDGDLIRVESKAKPLIVVYCDAVEETHAHDVFCAISRDDGNTWKRKNVSRMADRSSFELANSEEYYGHCKKPVFQVKGNKILITWTSKFARGGKPRYAIKTMETDPDDLEPYPYDDPYYTDDIWGVAGPQLSVTYEDHPEVGEVPYSAVWTVRGLILTSAELGKAPFNALDTDGDPLYELGDIVWFKPERLTSGRRDANQIFLGGADSAGFAMAWQEDPEGLRPGEAKGPGPGWGGATTNHKTDIWYSFITWSDFAKVDTHFIAGGDPEHDNEDFAERPKALVPMSLPVRISDNDAVNTDNMLVEVNETTGLPVFDGNGNLIPITNVDASSGEGDGSHRYGYMVDGLWDWNGLVHHEGDVLAEGDPTGDYLYEFTNQQGETKRVVITTDGRALDGNTGAARPNVFLQTYTKPDGAKSAWAIMAYEETKGLGSGPPDETGTGSGSEDGSGYDPYDLVPDEGKNAIYHSFDFQNPDLVSAGTILNLPETDDVTGEPLYVVQPPYLGSNLVGDEYVPIPNPDAGEIIPDWKGDPILAYENARRPRFILQSKTAAFGGFKPNGDYKEPNNSGTVLMVLFKEGEDGAGRPSDIIARRCVVKDPSGAIRKGNPWAPKNFLPHSATDTRAAVQNLSTVMPGTLWVNPERDESAKGDGTKVCDWTQPEACLWWKSKVNPYEDARAHRGQIRGDFLIMGYSYTPNWAASRNAHDKYDFYIRRSFNGGETWTTNPSTSKSVTHIDYFINPDGVSGNELDEDGNDITEATKHYTVESIYPGGGVYEKARNVSLIKNNKISVIEPRIVAVPGTIKKAGVWTGIDEDKQNRNVCYLAYGTSTNLPDVEKAPEDLFLSYTDDKGTTLYEDSWVVNPDSSGNYAGEEVSGWYRLAKGDPEQGEVQIRMTPDGTRFYSSWIEEGEEGSDIWFRRIMPPTFESNVAVVVGDLDADKDIDVDDYYAFIDTWGASSGDARFNPRADLYEDGVINFGDYMAWYNCYMQFLYNN